MLTFASAFWLIFFTGYVVFFIVYAAANECDNLPLWKNLLISLLWPFWLGAIIVVWACESIEYYIYK